jgi:hypothetical protein
MSEATKKAPHVLSKDVKAAEHARAVHFARGPMLPLDEAVAAMRDPAFWANVSTRMHANDRIEAMPEDGSYFAEFMVRSAGPNWAHVEVLRQHAFISAESVVAKAKDAEVNWGGPAHKWRVQRPSDKAVLKSGFDTPDQANSWLAANTQSVTA